MFPACTQCVKRGVYYAGTGNHEGQNENHNGLRADIPVYHRSHNWPCRACYLQQRKYPASDGTARHLRRGISRGNNSRIPCNLNTDYEKRPSLPPPDQGITKAFTAVISKYKVKKQTKLERRKTYEKVLQEIPSSL